MPLWRKPQARAALVGMSRTTGRAEIVRAAEESIAFQIAAVVRAAAGEGGVALKELRADGGPTRDRFLMQFQADILGLPVAPGEREELSATGAAWLAGQALGLYGPDTSTPPCAAAFTPRP